MPVGMCCVCCERCENCSLSDTHPRVAGWPSEENLHHCVETSVRWRAAMFEICLMLAATHTIYMITRVLPLMRPCQHSTRVQEQRLLKSPRFLCHFGPSVPHSPVSLTLANRKTTGMQHMYCRLFDLVRIARVSIGDFVIWTLKDPEEQEEDPFSSDLASSDIPRSFIRLNRPSSPHRLNTSTTVVA